MKPFDLYYDFKDFIIRVGDFIRIKFLLFKSWLNINVYTPVKTRVITIEKIIVKWIKKVINFIISKIRYASKQFVDKVAAPLYIYCVNKLIALKKIIVLIFNTTKQFLVFILKLLKSLIITFY